MSKAIIRINTILLLLALLLGLVFSTTISFALETEELTSATVTDQDGRAQLPVNAAQCL